MTRSRMANALGVLLVVCSVLSAVAAPAGAATKKQGTFEYGEGMGSAWGNVSCHDTLTISKKYLSNSPNEGGLEREKCVSTEPDGKLTGFFTPGQEYNGYWESDFYHFLAPSFGGENTQKFPSTLTIKVAKNFKSFRVTAVYPPAGNE